MPWVLLQILPVIFHISSNLNSPQINIHHITTKIGPQNYIIPTQGPTLFSLWVKPKESPNSLKSHYELANSKFHYDVAYSKSNYDVVNSKSHYDVANSMSHYDVANSMLATMRHYLQNPLLHGISKNPIRSDTSKRPLLHDTIY